MTFNVLVDLGLLHVHNFVNAALSGHGNGGQINGGGLGTSLSEANGLKLDDSGSNGSMVHVMVDMMVDMVVHVEGSGISCDVNGVDGRLGSNVHGVVNHCQRLLMMDMDGGGGSGLNWRHWNWGWSRPPGQADHLGNSSSGRLNWPLPGSLDDVAGASVSKMSLNLLLMLSQSDPMLSKSGNVGQNNILSMT